MVNLCIILQLYVCIPMYSGIFWPIIQNSASSRVSIRWRVLSTSSTRFLISSNLITTFTTRCLYCNQWPSSDNNEQLDCLFCAVDSLQLLGSPDNNKEDSFNWSKCWVAYLEWILISISTQYWRPMLVSLFRNVAKFRRSQSEPRHGQDVSNIGADHHVILWLNISVSLHTHDSFLRTTNGLRQSDQRVRIGFGRFNGICHHADRRGRIDSAYELEEALTEIGPY